jgi:protein gp37
VSPSKIEWTGETWNPTTGCDKVSEGCRSCYALTLAGRLKRMGQAKYQRDGDPRTSGPGFGLTLHPDALEIPLRRKKPTTFFVDSMSDLFHPEVPEGFIGSVWNTMALAPQHTFQVLTKRPQRARAVLEGWAKAGWLWRRDDMLWCGPLAPGPLPNVWLGTSIESDTYTWRADHLRATPAAVRFLSLEPLIGPVPSLNLDGIDWVIVGGESGRHARPMHPQWVRDVRDRCVAVGVPFFFKQWGAWWPGPAISASSAMATHHGFFCADGRFLGRSVDPDSRVDMARVGKKAAGRQLDGRTWDEMPDHAGAVA